VSIGTARGRGRIGAGDQEPGDLLLDKAKVKGHTRSEGEGSTSKDDDVDLEVSRAQCSVDVGAEDGASFELGNLDTPASVAVTTIA
jgi:hypothetical protein